MAHWQAYLQVDSVEGALQALMADPSSAVIAGGTDLLLDMRQGRHPPVHALVDVSAVAEMRQVLDAGEWITLGAALPLNEIIAHPLISEHAQGLVEACELIGGPQVRNVATLGGNVAHALPAGDGTIALLSLGGQAEIASPEGRRWVPIEALFQGPGEPAFERSREMIVSFRIPARNPREGSAFRRIMRPQGVAIAILNMGVKLGLDDEDRVQQAGIALGPAGPTPLRCERAEAVLLGETLSVDLLKEASNAVLTQAQLRTSPHRATQSYRQHLVRILLERAVKAAFARAGGG
jgi:CO/xanthine dehydrogenase FAD-binding subunit